MMHFYVIRIHIKVIFKIIPSLVLFWYYFHFVIPSFLLAIKSISNNKNNMKLLIFIMIFF
jgi:hypothetical protein